MGDGYRLFGTGDDLEAWLTLPEDDPRFQALDAVAELKSQLQAAQAERDRIVAHVRSYGLTPEGERGDGSKWTLADVIENAFVSHCAVDVCSAVNEPGTHWCSRHKSLIADYVKAERERDALREAVETVTQEFHSRVGPDDVPSFRDCWSGTCRWVTELLG